MKEIKCKQCGKVYSKSEKVCPHCGAKNSGRMKKFVALGIVIVALVAAFIPLNSVWVGHIPESYTYNSELSKPSTIVSWADMSSGIVQTQLERRLENARKELENASFDDVPDGFVVNSFAVPVDGGEITIYSIEPEELAGATNSPVIIYNHGGAFYYPLSEGGIYSMAYYAKELGAKVFIPSYRTSKEAPFPTPMLDCYAAALYVEDHADELGVNIDQLIFMGDSAGGCLTAGVTQYIRDNGGPVAKGEILIFPVTDISTDYESKTKYRDAAWPENANENMWDIYLANGDQGMLKYAVPNQSDDFSNLPRTYIEAAEIDVLHDEAIAYAENLRTAGVEVEIYEVPGGYHGFDADQSNAFVQRFMNQRVEAMKRMLED